jgi:hypothetical protein
VIYLSLAELVYIAERATGANDAAYELIMQIAAGELDSVDEIAGIPETSTAPRP